MNQQEFLGAQYQVFETAAKKIGKENIQRMVTMLDGKIPQKLRYALETNNPLPNEFVKTQMTVSSFALQLLHIMEP